MARWATKVIIAGVDFTGCRATLIDAQAFHSDFAGSADWANDNTVHTQVVNRGKKGIRFGVQFLSTEQDKLEDMILAIQTAQNTNTTFVVDVEEGFYDVEVNAVPDYSVDPWFTHDKHSEGWYENVTLRFISKSAV
jgi:hypothetical protein